MNPTPTSSEILFYIGTYTQPGKSAGIHAAMLDIQTGKISSPWLAAEVENPTWVTLSQNGKFLYASREARESKMVGFRLEENGRKLQTLNVVSTGGDTACHLSMDKTEKILFVANYGNGSVEAVQVLEDGSLGERTAFIKYEVPSADPAKQRRSFAHGIYADAENKRVYVCDLGTDRVWIHRFDAKKGTLRPSDPPFAEIPAQSGPRHLVLHSKGRIAYTNGEMGLNVTVFKRSPINGALLPIQTISTLPEGAERKGATTSGIALHPSEKWLYVSNRGHDSITVYSVASDGKLTWIENVPAQVRCPRGFGIDPSGQWLVVGGQVDDRITTLKINSDTGKLMPSGHTVGVFAPVCIAFTPATK